MDHNEAVRLQAAEKYVLGELPAKVREEYEEHFFDCAACALDVKAAAAFVDNSREVLRQESRNEAAKARWPAEGGWFRWFKPVVAVPVFAALLLLVVYQNLVSVPHWKKMAARSAASRVLPMFSLMAANIRSSESLTIRARSGEPFGLYVDIPVDPAYDTYLLRLEDATGQSTILTSISFDEAQRAQIVEVNPGSHPGEYQVVVLGVTGQNRNPGKATVLRVVRLNVKFMK